jgi:carbon monoxide dehydrogenase subunit G
MITVVASVCIETPADEVWAQLAKLEDIRLWSEAVLDARCEGTTSRGVGAERTCDLRGGISIRERWLAWDEGRSFTYEGDGLPGVAQARNHWSVHPEGPRTLLSSKAEVELKGGRIARLLEPVLERRLKRVGTRTLAAFKFLVETGSPPQGKHRRLPRTAATC